MPLPAWMENSNTMRMRRQDMRRMSESLSVGAEEGTMGEPSEVELDVMRAKARRQVVASGVGVGKKHE